MSRAVLHVGLPKTGTTYLQGALWANREELGRRGLLLPGHRRRHLLAALEVGENPTLARRRPDVPHPWTALVEEAAGWSGDVLISHEFLGAASGEQAARAVSSLAPREVHVVVTARAMVDLFISRWQEWVKNGGRKPIDAYPTTDDDSGTDEWGWSSFDLGIVLDRWSAAVPPERIHVLPVAPGRSDPRELWGRFMSVVGVDGSDLDAPEEPANPSLGLVEVELLRRVVPQLQGFGSAFDRGRWIRGYLGEGHVLPSSGEKFRPGDEKLADLRARADRAEQLLRSGGFDVVGDLEDLRGSDLTGRRHPSEVTEAELLAASTRTIAAMLTDVRSLTPEAGGGHRAAPTADQGPGQRVSVPRRLRRRVLQKRHRTGGE